MTVYYFDTSALVKLYHDEAGTEEVEKIFAFEEEQINISELAVIELYSAFYRLLRMKEISEDTVETALESFDEDCKYRFVIKSVNSDATNKAKNIIKTYGNTKSIRTLDAIQLSVSLGIVDDVIFVSADELLLEIAEQENLEILKVGLR